MRPYASLACLALSVAAFAQYPGAVSPPKDLKKGFDTISIGDAKRILTYLATKCEGRGTGQPGFEKAAEFVAKQFKSLLLKPLGDNGTFFQKTEFTRWRFDPKSLKLSIDGSKPSVDGKDIILRSGTPELDLHGPILFAKIPSTVTNLGAASFKDQIVILDSDKRSTYLENLILDGGAKAVLSVVKLRATASWHPRMGKTPPTVRPRVAGVITSEAAAKLQLALASSTKTETTPSSGVLLDSYAAPASLTAKLIVETVMVGNVVAELSGSDPVLAKQYVGIGGHLDHLGVNDGVVYPGADDDGSGSTAVIEIARAMVANPVKPKRSIVFMTFFGEEMGLLGSRYLTQHPPVPLPDMVAELQMDMVGRDSDGVQNGDPSRVDVASENVDTIRLVGSKRISTQLDQVIQEENKYIGFKFKYDAEDVYTRSDHYNFAAKGIPIAFLFDGFHPDYHRPTDTIEKIDWLKLTNAAKLYYLTGLEIANADAPPAKDVAVTRTGG